MYLRSGRSVSSGRGALSGWSQLRPSFPEKRAPLRHLRHPSQESQGRPGENRPMRLEPIGVPERPVPYAMVTQHLRVEADAEPLEVALVESYIDSAVEWAEKFTRRSLLLQQYRLTLPSAGQEICLPQPPLHDVSRVEVDGVDLEPDAYEVRTHDSEGNEAWPGAVILKQPPSGEVVVEYQAGYSEATLPRRIQQAVLLTVGHWYENRQEVSMGVNPLKVPMAAEALLWMSRMAL